MPEQPACVALDRLYSPRMPLDERNCESLLSIVYLEKPEQGHHMSELTQRHTIIILNTRKVDSFFLQLCLV